MHWRRSEGRTLYPADMWPFRRKPRYCDVHDAPSQYRIRQLEQELGLEQSPAEGDLVDQFTNPALIDCGRQWCREARRGSAQHSEVGGHASANVTIDQLPHPPNWAIQPRG